MFVLARLPNPNSDRIPTAERSQQLFGKVGSRTQRSHAWLHLDRVTSPPPAIDCRNFMSVTTLKIAQVEAALRPLGMPRTRFDSFPKLNMHWPCAYWFTPLACSVSIGIVHVGAVAESESPSSISHSPLPRNPFLGRCPLVMQRPHAPTSAASSPACVAASMAMCVSRSHALGVVVPWARATSSSRTCFLCLTLGRSRMAYTSDYEVCAPFHFMPHS